MPGSGGDGQQLSPVTLASIHDSLAYRRLRLPIRRLRGTTLFPLENGDVASRSRANGKRSHIHLRHQPVGGNRAVPAS